MASLFGFGQSYNVGLSSLNRTTLKTISLFTIGLGRNMKPDLRKVRFTGDSKYLFLKVAITDEDFGAVAIINVQYPRVTYVDDSETSKCYDYGLLDSDRFVVVCKDMMAQ